MLKPLTSAEQKEDPTIKIPTLSEETSRDKQSLILKDVDIGQTWNDYIGILENTPLTTAVSRYLETLKLNTRKNYAYYFSDLISRKIIPKHDAHGNPFTVGNFNNINHEATLQFIKQVPDWSEGTRQLKCACYISLTSYLSYVSRGWFRKAQASKLKSNPTFFALRDKVATNALNIREWNIFISKLKEFSARDSLIAQAMLQGAKRISEVLSLTTEQIDWEKKIIRFKQSKTGGTQKEIPISFPNHFMNDLKKYIDETTNIRKDFTVFITQNGKPIIRCHINSVFKKISERCGLPKVKPHSLRASWVSIAKENKAEDSEIMSVTGHTSSRMIFMYDKRNLENNLTKELVLI